MVNAQHPVALVLSGLPSLIPFIERDPQVCRRSRFISFKSLDASDIPMIDDALMDFTDVAGLNLELPEANRFVPRLMHAGLHQLGTVVEIMREAIEHVLVIEDTSLTTAHFAHVYAERTGSAAPVNPFLSSRYDIIDCSRVLDGDQRTPSSERNHPDSEAATENTSEG